MGKLILLAGLLTGCAKSHLEVLSIPETFQPIYQRFLRDAKTHEHELTVTDLIIRFGDLGGIEGNGSSLNGNCHTETDSTPIITITNNPHALFQWFTASYADQEDLLYHELGHCLLLRAHNPSVIEVNGVSIPISIMTPDLINSFIYEQNRTHYIDELFLRARNNR